MDHGEILSCNLLRLQWLCLLLVFRWLTSYFEMLFSFSFSSFFLQSNSDVGNCLILHGTGGA